MTKREALETLSDRYYALACDAREHGRLREALHWINRSLYAAREANRHDAGRWDAS